MVFLVNIRFSFFVMIFQLPEGTRLSERVEARNRLLQAYDEEVTIGELSREPSGSGGFQTAAGK
jgi:hypothetical protein